MCWVKGDGEVVMVEVANGRVSCHILLVVRFGLALTHIPHPNLAATHTQKQPAGTKVQQLTNHDTMLVAFVLCRNRPRQKDCPAYFLCLCCGVYSWAVHWDTGQCMTPLGERGTN